MSSEDEYIENEQYNEDSADEIDAIKPQLDPEELFLNENSLKLVDFLADLRLLYPYILNDIRIDEFTNTLTDFHVNKIYSVYKETYSKYYNFVYENIDELSSSYYYLNREYKLPKTAWYSLVYKSMHFENDNILQRYVEYRKQL